MATLLRRGFALLNRGMEAAASEAVRYLRGPAVISEGMSATLAAPDVETVTEGGATIIGRQFTWRVKRSELRVENVEDKPRRGDRIEWDFGGKVHVFEVVPELASPAAGAVDMRSDFIPVSVKLVDQRVLGA